MELPFGLSNLLSPAEEDRGIGTLRRLYFYNATLVYMLVAAAGVLLVADYLLDEAFGPRVLVQDTLQVSIGIVLALVWIPIWAWHRLRVQRFVEEEPTERRSILRKNYVYLTVGVTVALAAFASVELLIWALRITPFYGYPVAGLVIWGGLWLFHWIAESKEGQPTGETKTVRREYLYITSACSLVALAVGLSFVIYVVLSEAYDGLWPVPVLTQGDEALWGEVMKSALAVTLVAATLWAWHWLYAARLDAGSHLRQFYLQVFAIPGGVIAAIGAAGFILFGVLQWLIGTPEEATASAHFRFLPAALAPLVVGLGLWLYHRTVVERERAAVGELPVARQIYGYVMAALGLAALVAATIVLVSTVIGIGITEARDVLVGGDWWRDRMTLATTLGLLGSTVWGYYWFSMQRRAETGGSEERSSLPRRVLVYGVVGAGVLAILGTISYLLVVFLNGLLEQALSLTLLRDAKWGIGALVAAVLIVPYYWLILREDRLAAGEPVAKPVARPKSVTVLMPNGGGPFLTQLEGALRRRVRVLHRVGPDAGVPAELSTDELRGLERSIAAAASGRVLLVADATGVQVYSYR